MIDRVCAGEGLEHADWAMVYLPDISREIVPIAIRGDVSGEQAQPNQMLVRADGEPEVIPIRESELGITEP